jgi:hypothetical protein
MKSMYTMFAAGSMLGAAAMAQDDPKATFERMAPQIKVMGVQAGVMGKTVKGAPYSGVEISESTQMLADGTRIHNEMQTQVFRDGEGRMRRETPNEVTIWDPVANASWVLNAKTQTARKLPMGVFYFNTNRSPNGEATSTYAMGGGVWTAGKPGTPADEKGTFETRVVELRTAEARMKTDIESHVRMSGGMAVATAAPNLDVIKRGMMREKAVTEPIGKRTIEGVNAEGTRSVSTIEIGAIGNDRPIQSVTERWFSPDLQTIMLSKTTDPRSGEEVFKLVNVNRSEPAAYLFQVPAGYQIVEQK